ncbi:hypothetical protein POM88_012732 [Heracleum sosnowskyi]|uniref:Phosphofructokinase domain-containing protein n=1 Tax=Heracleum sosnowskyi TaxID=360622 RepID=A0AAD8N2K6_9APIA|nr:hypothetical protein POM88_012732 [Heracleum sosnowskyi]
MYRLHRVPVQRTWPTLQFQSAYSLRNEARNLYIHNLGENMDWKWVCLIHLVLASKVIVRSFGFDTAVEEAQRAINVAHVEAESAENGVGVVKLMGRYCEVLYNMCSGTSALDYIVQPKSARRSDTAAQNSVNSRIGRRYYHKSS